MIFEFDTLRFCQVASTLVHPPNPRKLFEKTPLEERLSKSPDEFIEEAKFEEDALLEFNHNYVTIKGLITRQGFDHLIFEEDRVESYTSLQALKLEERQLLTYTYEFDYLVG